MTAPAWRDSRRDRALRATLLTLVALGLALGLLLLAAATSAASLWVPPPDDPTAVLPTPSPG
ncbi:hypothetical protein [Demequina rhizosphaerae]|uniref:hypothetical protein n=1 Tax=Demequina rhizosphaerae TaxID=1638985 RepID=UPI0007818744|nr:hypothetical protein [Demequina rhizosphaerae]